MKKFLILLLFALLFTVLSFSFAACKKAEEKTPESNGTDEVKEEEKPGVIVDDDGTIHLPPIVI